MKFMDAIAKFLGRHPLFAAVLVVMVFGAVGVLDRRSEERAEAYRQGLIDGKGNTPTVRKQLHNICSQPWPDVKGAAEARARACPATED